MLSCIRRICLCCLFVGTDASKDVFITRFVAITVIVVGMAVFIFLVIIDASKMLSFDAINTVAGAQGIVGIFIVSVTKFDVVVVVYIAA